MRVKLLFGLLIFCTLIKIQESYSKLIGRIFRGSPPLENDHPWHVSIGTVEPIIHCGASIIHREWLLTAAHCLVKRTSVFVILGAHNIKMTSSHFILHPKYNNFTYDMALIKLPTKLNWTDKIKNIRLVSSKFEGQVANITGNGIHNYSIMDTYELRTASFQIVNRKECDKPRPLDKGMMCLEGYKANNASLCSGDSGSALVACERGKCYQIGIATGVVGSVCDLGKPSICTAIDAEFIKNITGEDLVSKHWPITTTENVHGSISPYIWILAISLIAFLIIYNVFREESIKKWTQYKAVET